MTDLQDTECRCDDCSDGCHESPGWFAPGQAERVAEHLGVTLEELFRDKLVVEYWAGGIDDHATDIHVLAPANYASTSGEKAEFSKMRARCVFLDNEGLCSIHPVKPKECALSHHNMDQDAYLAWRKDNVRAWIGRQDQIDQLLGEHPEESSGRTTLPDWVQ